MLVRQWGRAALKVIGSISFAALVALMGYEGFVSPPYQDQAGVWTNGYGNTKGVTRNTPPVTKAQAKVALEAHVGEFTESVLKSLTLPPTQGQLDAYVSLTYNIGPAAFRTSAVRTAHNANRPMDACLYMLRWHKITVNGVKVPNRGLSLRRYAEYNTCLSGVPPESLGYVPRRIY